MITHQRLCLTLLLCSLYGAPYIQQFPIARAQDDAITPERIPPQVESAIDRGLESLAQIQQSNGSWSISGSGGGGGGNTARGAVTGLALMAFMARGHVPGQGPYGERLNHAVDFILSLKQPDGMIAVKGARETMYEHAICTTALCEAYGMLDPDRQEHARVAIGQAVGLILSAQRVPKGPDAKGGWRYTVDAADSDVSVSGWQLMALRGATNVGAFLPPSAIADGIDYLKHHVTGDGGFDYGAAGGAGGGGGNVALTGTGVVALSLMGQPDAREVKNGGAYLLRNSRDITNRVGNSHYFYSVYYCSQAAWQLGGQYWTTLSRIISTDLLHQQLPNGSWGTPDGSQETTQPYATAMAILALTVPYRYLPIYQR